MSLSKKMDYALQLLIPILLGLYIGHWLDEKTQGKPWFTLVGLILGMVLGIATMYKRVVLTQQQQKRDKDKEDK
jgi:F0F1-type ATP synthase assembly protein I